MDTIEDRVKAIVIEELGIQQDETLASDAKFTRDLGADSMDSHSLVLALEDEFAIEIPDRDAEQLKTVRQVVAYITARAGTATA